VSIWQSFKQEDDCLVHFVLLATTLLKDQESDNHHVLVRNLAKYSPILFFHSQTQRYTFLSCLPALMFHKEVVATTHTRCGGIFNTHFTANLLQNLPGKKLTIG